MQESQFLDAVQWAESEFGGAQLGDARREKRLVRIACALATDPQGSLHGSLRNWSELMGGYRLLKSPTASLEKVTQPHRDKTLNACRTPGEYFLVEDTTELDYSSHHSAQERRIARLDDNLARLASPHGNARRLSFGDRRTMCIKIRALP